MQHVLCSRKDFYKICLTTGRSRIHYAARIASVFLEDAKNGTYATGGRVPGQWLEHHLLSFIYQHAGTIIQR
ncbi:MAG: hypothetical protein LUH10_16390 [Tannerellaceae bacterium]|nr:hypothetical protein [Tannerellaceae bacterium]